jgi:hypothetical protein
VAQETAAAPPAFDIRLKYTLRNRRSDAQEEVADDA